MVGMRLKVTRSKTVKDKKVTLTQLKKLAAALARAQDDQDDKAESLALHRLSNAKCWASREDWLAALGPYRNRGY